MSTVNITLYQHTPLIHFQAKQEGATLRASDVKPRLDRFIITRMGWKASGLTDPETDRAKLHGYTEAKLYGKGWNYLKKHHPNWLAKSDDPKQCSLNYRMKIIAGPTKSPHSKQANKYANYFADTGNEKKPGAPVRKVTFHEVVLLQLTVPDDALRKHLQAEEGSLLARFFYATNFGTRASKGFGSFSPALKPAKEYVFKFFVPATDYDKLFRYLDLFNRTVRTGVNKISDPETGRFDPRNPVTLYMKPLVFQYAVSKDTVWEKKLIKETHQGGHYDGERYKLRTPPQKYQPKDNAAWPAWYEGPNDKGRKEATVRDAVGLATNQSWMKYGKEATKKSDADGTDASIDRAPSPFTYVPVKMKNGFAVYVYAQQPAQVYLDHSFHFRFASDALKKDKDGNWNGNVGTDGQLQVFPEFNMAEFLERYFNRKTVEDSIVTRGGNDEIIKATLLTIYQQIEDSLTPTNTLPA
jgi:hypothetical protein